MPDDGYGTIPQSMNNTGFQSYNTGYVTDSIMKYRLDVNDLFRDIELYLSGKKVELKQDDNGQWYETLTQSNDPLMNERGVSTILSSLKLIIGPHTVQGNLEKDMYDALIEEINIYLACDIMINRVAWQVKIEDYPIIVDVLMSTIILFLSRTIENGERLSYASTVKSIESSTINQKPRGFMGLFGGK